MLSLFIVHNHTYEFTHGFGEAGGPDVSISSLSRGGGGAKERLWLRK